MAKDNFKCSVSGNRVAGSYYDSYIKETVKFSGSVNSQNQLYLETSDSLGDRESFDNNLYDYWDGNGPVKRVRKITIREAVLELLGFKSFQDFI